MDEASLAALDREGYISLATFRRSGREVATPVWFAARNGKLYVFSEGTAGKVKRLRNDARIRVAPCNVRGTVRGEWIEGSGRRVDEPELVERAYRALLRKYGWQMRIANFFSRLTGRFDRRAILELEI
jgi:PPOX class probable F420-dependent enzyme